MNKLCKCLLCGKEFSAHIKWVGKFCCRNHYFEYVRTEGVCVRFWKNVEIRGKKECWPWTGRLDKHGYGRLSVGKTPKLAARIAVEIKIQRKLEKGECALHKCDNPRCVNPKHLWVGTQGDNMRDKEEKGRGNYAKGEKASNNRFTESDIRTMRNLYASGRFKLVEIARKFQTVGPVVSMIVHRKRWKHI